MRSAIESISLEPDARSSPFRSRVARRISKASRWWIAGGVALWGSAVLGGMGVLWAYSEAPGASADAPSRLPGGIDALRANADDKLSLIMLVHPQCPCSRASIAELSRVMGKVGDRVHARVFFLRPEGEAEGWEVSDLWKSAEAIPGVVVTSDPNGEKAAAFGAKTSGQVVLYDAEGELLFEGGITSARGHEGDNDGESRIVSLAREKAHASGEGAVHRSPVFGCGLFEEPRAER